MELTDLRGRIDEIDTQLAQLFKQRMDIARQVAEQKAKTGKQVLDPSRERQVLSGCPTWWARTTKAMPGFCGTPCLM